MKLGIMQPYFFPWIGYLQLVSAVDRFVIYDDVSWRKQSWINRNRILVGGEEHLFTLPTKGASPNRKILEVELGDVPRWRTKFLKLLQQEYRKAPRFDEVFPFVEEICSFESGNLADYIRNSLVRLFCELGITTQIVPTSRDYGNEDLRGQERVISVCKHEGADTYVNAIGGMKLYDRDDFRAAGLALRFIETRPIEYPQTNTQAGGSFVPSLSILDAMMWNPPSRITELLGEYDLV